MRNSISIDFDIRTRPALAFGQLTNTDVRELLLPFYVGLDFDIRRARFGGALSDEAVRDHCNKLDLGTSIVLGCWTPARLLAAIELHPMENDWKAAELSIADCAETDRTTIIGHLLQLAAFAAGKRGCSTLFVQSSNGETKDLLKGMGRIMTHFDLIAVDIGEYASILHR